jgi:hypothetical protein
MPVSTAEIVVAWVAGLMTLMIFSFLYKDNPFYKFAEHLFVGVSAAYWMVYGYWATLVPNLFAKIFPQWTAETFAPMGMTFDANAAAEPSYWIAAVLGLFMLARLIPPLSWLSRWALAFIVGWSAGTNLTRFVQSDFIAQIENTIGLVQTTPFDLVPILTAVVVVLGVVAGLVYFFFSTPHAGVVGGVSRVGIWVLMITFGASFGYTVMARISLLTGRLDSLQTLIRNPGGPY